MGQRRQRLDRGAYNPQHPLVGGDAGQIVLLNRTQRLSRSRVAGQDYQRTPLVEEVQHRLFGKLIDNLKRPCTVRGPGIVAQIEVVVLRQPLAHLFENGEAAVSRVEDTDRPYRRMLVLHIHL